MNIAKTIANLGPPIANAYLDTLPPSVAEVMREKLHTMIEQVADSALEQEHDRAAMHLAHLAADLLRGWPGEPTAQAAREAVEVAAELLKAARKAVTK